MAVDRDEPESVTTPLAHPGQDPDEPADDAAALGGAGHVELLPAGGPLRPILKAVGIVEQAIGSSLIVVILILVLIQVAQRYIHTFGGWPWTGEIARLSLVWCTFAVTGYLMAEDRHITIKVVDLVLRGRALGAIKVMSHLFVVATCLGMGYATYQLIAADVGQTTPAAGIPVMWIYVIPLFGYLLTALRAAMMVALLDIPEIMRGGEKTA